MTNESIISILSVGMPVNKFTLTITLFFSGVFRILLCSKLAQTVNRSLNCKRRNSIAPSRGLRHSGVD